MTEDLHTRLCGEIEERLAIARAAYPGPWRYNQNKAWRGPGQAFLEEYVAAGPLDVPTCVAATGPADNPQSMSDARFIALHDPADAIRRYEAALRVLERHAPVEFGDCAYCGARWQDGASGAWPCPDILDLASSLAIEVGG